MSEPPKEPPDTIREMFTRIENKLDALGTELNGNHEHPGVKGRITKLETVEESRRWKLRALYASAVAFLVNAVFGWFGARH